MANSTALILLLIAAAAAVSASAHTAAVTAGRMYKDEKCEREVEQQMPMTSCEKWIRSKVRKGPYNDAAFLRSAVADRGFKEEHVDECCGELRRFSPECRCAAGWEMMMGMTKLEMRRLACTLPSRCGFRGCGCPRVFA